VFRVSREIYNAGNLKYFLFALIPSVLNRLINILCIYAVIQAISCARRLDRVCDHFTGTLYSHQSLYDHRNEGNP